MQKQSSVIWIVAMSALLLLFHQDFWLWNNATLVFGIFPIGLFWHLCISIAAMMAWTYVTIWCWPFQNVDSVEVHTDQSWDGDRDSSEPQNNGSLSGEEKS
ncbi:hypothetical protein OAA27_02175 [bacterium]|nr:hypothetical protein [bacterium]